MRESLGDRAFGGAGPLRVYVDRCVLMCGFIREDGAFGWLRSSTHRWDRGDLESLTMSIDASGRRVFTITEARAAFGLADAERALWPKALSAD